ncbi:MAG: TauD/TfdA family dioxygenase [Acidimicrobiales bacterium]
MAHRCDLLAPAADGSILRAIEVPAYGGDTMWLDLEAAFAGLSRVMQEFASSLTAVNSAPRSAFIPGNESGEVITSRHPVVRTLRPVTGSESGGGSTRAGPGGRGGAWTG